MLESCEQRELMTMIELDPSRWKTEPRPEQIDGVRHFLSKPHTCLFDEQGVGKTKQVIDAACTLFEAGEIDTLIVVCPAAVRGVWDEPELGELAKHAWVPYQTLRIDAKWKGVISRVPDRLTVLLISYGYIRKKSNHEYPVPKAIGKALGDAKAWLVFDESSYIKSHAANQYKAAEVLRSCEQVVRVSILNGTPIANSILDLWSQFHVVDPFMLYDERLKSPLSFTQFRAKYCILTLKQFPGRKAFYDIVGENKDEIKELRKFVKPWVIRRRTEQCVNLPPKIYSFLEATMSTEGWRAYCEMRDQLVAWFKDNPSLAKNGAVKMIRLAQITSGFLGGIDSIDGETTGETVEVDRSKLDAFLEWFDTHDKTHPIIVWCRFRKELERLSECLNSNGFRVGLVYGGQSDKQRQGYINEFQRGNIDVLIGQPQAGGIGLNLTQANIEVYISNDYNLITRLQSEARTHRTGQTRQVYIVDILAKGPNGQRTIDYKIYKALKDKEDFANWTSAEWIKKLRED